MSSHLPFRGLSAWFSCSVELKVVQQWGDHGGLFIDHTSADYLFSDNANSHDTMKVYADEAEEVAVFRPSWIEAVLERGCSVHDVPVGQHLLCPHFMSTASHTDTPPQPHSQLQPQEKKKEDCYKLSVGTITDTHQLWRALERLAKSCKISEAVYIDDVISDEKMYHFDCSKPQFVIKRID